jgi:hypothetical protein
MSECIYEMERMLGPNSTKNRLVSITMIELTHDEVSMSFFLVDGKKSVGKAGVTANDLVNSNLFVVR